MNVGKRLHTFCTPFAHLSESGTFLRKACTACFPLHTADFLSKLLSLTFFLLLPTVMKRPEVTAPGFWNDAIRFLYRVDKTFNEKGQRYLQRKGLATGNGIFFSRNWSPTLERASISSQTVERPAIHGRNASGIRRRISVSVFSDDYYNRLNC